MRGIGVAALAALVAAGPASAQSTGPDVPPVVRDLTIETARLCISYGGQPYEREGYATQLDLNGDGIGDWMIDATHINCRGAPEVTCVSSGCPAAVALSEPEGEFTLLDLGPIRRYEIEPGDLLPTLIVFYDRSNCGEDWLGIEGCARRWVFDSNDPELPAAED